MSPDAFALSLGIAIALPFVALAVALAVSFWLSDRVSNRRRALDLASRHDYGKGPVDLLARAREIEAYLNGRAAK